MLCVVAVALGDCRKMLLRNPQYLPNQVEGSVCGVGRGSMKLTSLNHSTDGAVSFAPGPPLPGGLVGNVSYSSQCLAHPLAGGMSPLARESLMQRGEC